MESKHPLGLSNPCGRRDTVTKNATIATMSALVHSQKMKSLMSPSLADKVIRKMVNNFEGY